MGFLKKLFEKKDCEICGGEIGLLGNRKLEDGDCCKNCAAKLSPWFDERRHSTVEQIKAQIAYREQNEAALASFKLIKSIGENYKMYVEYDGQNPSRFIVTSHDLMTEGNPDIVPFTNVSGCEVDIRDSRTEEKRRNNEGEYVSYNPPRYKFHYDFYIKLTIRDIPWFDDIRFKVNDRTVEIISELDNRIGRGGDIDPTFNPEYREYVAMCDEITQIVSAGQNPQSGPALPPELLELERQNKFWDSLNAEPDLAKKVALLEAEAARIEGTADADYQKRVAEMLKACRYTLDPSAMAAAMTNTMQAKTQELAEEAKETVPKLGDPGVCPDCGAADQTGKFCEYCGAKMTE